MRNVHAAYEEVKQAVEWPQHKRLPHKVMNMHESGLDKAKAVYDPYHWVQNITDAQAADFTHQEDLFTRMLLMKYDYLDKQILRE